MTNFFYPFCLPSILGITGCSEKETDKEECKTCYTGVGINYYKFTTEKGKACEFGRTIEYCLEYDENTIKFNDYSKYKKCNSCVNELYKFSDAG